MNRCQRSFSSPNKIISDTEAWSIPWIGCGSPHRGRMVVMGILFAEWSKVLPLATSRFARQDSSFSHCVCDEPVEYFHGVTSEQVLEIISLSGEIISGTEEIRTQSTQQPAKNAVNFCLSVFELNTKAGLGIDCREKSWIQNPVIANLAQQGVAIS